MCFEIAPRFLEFDQDHKGTAQYRLHPRRKIVIVKAKTILYKSSSHGDCDLRNPIPETVILEMPQYPTGVVENRGAVTVCF